MSFTVLWTDEAYSTFEKRIEYLMMHWTDKEIRHFKNRVMEYLDTLKEEPFIGKRAGKSRNVHIGLIIKQVSVIYRIKVKRKEIELISFIDNRQDPRKIKKYTS